MKHYKLNKVGLAVSTALLLSAAPTMAAAQESESKKNVEEVEKIEVRGIRGSVVKSLNTKRFSASVVDAISSEDIGKFPDKNVAESLQRISGVSITRNFGEGVRVSIRGTAPGQNRTLLNGQSVGSADWWISASPNRGFNYTMLPSEVVSSLEVYKSPEADIDEGSIGGSVILRTRKPLDMDSGKFVGSLMGQYSEVSGETDPQLSGLYSWKNEEESFGALVSVIRQERNLRRDGLEAWSWATRDITTADGQVHEDVYSPGGGGSALFRQDRIRNGVTATLQFRPNDNTDITFNALNSVLEANNNNQNFLWLVGYGDSQLESITTESHSKVGTIMTGGTIGLSPESNNILYETIARNSEIDTQSYDLKVEHQGEVWLSSVHAGYTAGGGGTQADRRIGWEGNYVHTFDTGTEKDVKLSYDADPNDGSKWDLGYIRQDKNDTNDKESYIQADFERDVDIGVFSLLKFGAKYRNHTRDFIRIDSNLENPGWSLADYSLAFPSNYLSGIGSGGTLRSYAYTDVGKASEAIDAVNWTHTEVTASTFDINEKIFAGYVKADIDTDSLRGNMGLRVVKTNQTSSAFVGDDWTDVESDYTDILPSLNLAMDLSEDVILRFAAARVMSRPEYSQMTSSTRYNLETRTGDGGNARLDPFRATQFDISTEWYFNESSILSVALFYKDIQSFIETTGKLENIEGVDILINRPRNGKGGTIQGFELNYMQDLFENAGVSANYTYVDGKAKDANGDDTVIPGNSKHTLNLSAYYEGDKLSGRLSYNYRTGYDSGLGWPGYNDAYGQLDGNLTYELNENTSLIFEAINLTDEHTFSYQQEGVKIAPTSVYHDGRRFLAGVRVSF